MLVSKVTFDDLVFQTYAEDKVERARHQFGSYALSVIKEPGKKFYEAAIYDEHLNFVQLPGIHKTPSTDEEFVDDVIPYLTPEQVSGIMLKLQTIQGAEE